MWSRMNVPERERFYTARGFCFGSPVWVNCMCTSVTLLGEIPENPLSESDDGNPVPGSVHCGLNLAKLWIIVDTPESMTCQVA